VSLFESGQHDPDSTWQTPLERAGWARFSRSGEMTLFLHALAASHEDAQVETWGYSVKGQPLTALRLHRCQGDGGASKLRVLLVGSQHGASEAAGGEALLVLARQCLHGDLQHLLDSMDLYVLPNANPDGRDADSSKNANDVNLNRDYVLLSQPESRALDKALARIQPHVVLDAHESAALKRKSLGLEGYMTTFDVQLDSANNPGVTEEIQGFCDASILQPFLDAIARGGLQAQRYIKEIGSTRQPLTHGGITARVFRNKAGLTGALSFLLETRMDPKGGVYPTFRNIQVRRSKQLFCIRQFLELLRVKASDVLGHCEKHRLSHLASHYVLHADFVEHPHEPITRLPLRRLDTLEITEIEFVNHRHLRLHAPIELPQFYYVADHLDWMAHMLHRHSLVFARLEEECSVDVEVLILPRIDSDEDAALTVVTARRRVLLPRGSLRVPVGQARGLLLPQLLELQSTSSFFAYSNIRKRCLAAEAFFVYRAYR
jgi:hypothetical protein